jgi:hypothetical protein
MSLSDFQYILLLPDPTPPRHGTVGSVGLDLATMENMLPQQRETLKYSTTYYNQKVDPLTEEENFRIKNYGLTTEEIDFVEENLCQPHNKCDGLRHIVVGMDLDELKGLLNYLFFNEAPCKALYQYSLYMEQRVCLLCGEPDSEFVVRELDCRSMARKLNNDEQRRSGFCNKCGRLLIMIIK